MRPKSFGNRNDAENGTDGFRIIGTQNFLSAHFSQFLNRAEILFLQPVRHLGIPTFSASQFNDCRHCVGVPVSRTAVPMNPYELWYRGVRGIPNVALVVQFLPKLLPSCCGVALILKFREGRTGVEWNLVTSRKLAPALVVEAQHTSGIYHIQGIGGFVGENRRHQLRISALCLRAQHNGSLPETTRPLAILSR